MAPKSRAEAESRDALSSDEEEGSSSEENEEESGSESEDDQNDKPLPVKKPSIPKKPDPTPQAPAQPQSSSSDESGSESDYESDSPRRPDPNIKPLASKPMEEATKVNKKPTSSSTSTPVKRPAESEKDTTDRDSKKAKKTPGEDSKKTPGEDSKKQLFQRLWSEEDEIEILKGMIDYAKKGSDPMADMNAFHDFIKKSLHVDVSKTQLSDKVRRLRKKYENNASKGKKGEDRPFSKPHEQKAFDLSKKIWGATNNGGSVGEDSVKDRKKQNHRAIAASPKKSDINGLASPDRVGEGTKIELEKSAGSPWSPWSSGLGRITGESGVEEEILKYGLDLITGSKKSELEKKWRKLKVEEIELYLKRVDLIREQTQLVLGAMKSPEH